MALLVVLGLMSVGGLAEEVSQMMELTWRTWRNYLGNLVDLASFALFMVLFGMVWASYTYDVILAVGAIETLVLFVRLVFFASMTDSMGSLMRMVIEIIKDMRYFFALLAMIFGGFAIAFAVLLVSGPRGCMWAGVYVGRGFVGSAGEAMLCPYSTALLTPPDCSGKVPTTALSHCAAAGREQHVRGGGVQAVQRHAGRLAVRLPAGHDLRGARLVRARLCPCVGAGAVSRTRTEVPPFALGGCSNGEGASW